MKHSDFLLNDEVRKWSLDFTNRSRSIDSVPCGYDTSSNADQVEVKTQDADSEQLIVKKSWDIALGPIRQAPMTFFMLYMAGNSISIFPIMIIGMSFIRSVRAFFTVQQAFSMIQGYGAYLQKVAFCLGNIFNICIAVYKCHSMGILPTHASDWLAFVEPKIQLEYAGGGYAL